MELIDMAVLVAASKHSRKSDIVDMALRIVPPGPHMPGFMAHRETLRRIDSQVAARNIRQEGLGVYTITEQGQQALRMATSLLDTVSSAIRYGVTP